MDLFLNGIEYSSLTVNGMTNIITVEGEPSTFTLYDLNNIPNRQDYITNGDISLRIDDIYPIVKKNGVTNVFHHGKVLSFEMSKKILIDKGLIESGIDNLLDNGYIVYVQCIDTHNRPDSAIIVYISKMDSDEPEIYPYNQDIKDTEIELVISESGAAPAYILEGLKYEYDTDREWFKRIPLSLRSAFMLHTDTRRVNKMLMSPTDVLENSLSCEEYEKYGQLVKSMNTISANVVDIYSTTNSNERLNALIRGGLGILTPYVNMDVSYALIQLYRICEEDVKQLKQLLVLTNNNIEGWT